IALSASAETPGAIIAINNSGDLSAVSAGIGERDRATAGIRVLHTGGETGVAVNNSGAITVDAEPDSFDSDLNGIAAGIVTNVFGGASITQIDNSGAISATGQVTHGIVAFTENISSDLTAV